MVSIALQKGNYRTTRIWIEGLPSVVLKRILIVSHRIPLPPSHLKFSRVCDMADDEWEKGFLLSNLPGSSDSHFAFQTPRFRKECELVGPQSWRRFLPGLYWISKRHGPRPTKEWPAFVDDLLESLRALSREENMMLWAKHKAKLHGFNKVSKQYRHFAKWEIESFSQGDLANVN